MLTSLHVQGFKTLKNFAVSLAPVTVLLGANNVGKTNVIRALELLATAVQLGSLPRAIKEAGHDVRTRGHSIPLTFEVTGRLGQNPFTYRLTETDERLDILGPDGGSMARINDTFTLIGVDGRPVGVGGDPGSGLQALRNRTTGFPKPHTAIAGFLSGMRVADFSAERLREESVPEIDVVLGRHGENLAAVLDALQTKPSVRKRIDEEVRRAMPGVDALITVPRAKGRKVVAVAEGDQVFEAEDLSDGVLLFIALSTIAQMSGGSTLVGIEEIERGIHPRRIRETLDQVFRVTRSGSQFLLTTHSPQVLNEFRDTPESILVVERTEGLGTTAKPLSEVPDLEEAMRDLSLGDLWYSGVLGGVPAL